MSDVRLIDANALEKTAIPCEIHNGASTELCVPLYQIRTAPTVTPDMAQVLAYECGKASADRPTGEWINHRNDYGHNIADCSICGKAMQWHDEDEDGIPRYCWFCGARMKTEEVEEE